MAFKEGKAAWILPSLVDLPAAPSYGPPPPSTISMCACVPQTSCTTAKSQLETPPFLQLIAFGEDGVGAQEIPLGVVGGSKGKGKSDRMALTDPRHGQSFIGKTGFLAQGGHWHHLPPEITAPQWDGWVRGRQCSRLGAFIPRKSSGGSRWRLGCNHGTKHVMFIRPYPLNLK
jgi:hypothetical protein